MQNTGYYDDTSRVGTKRAPAGFRKIVAAIVILFNTQIFLGTSANPIGVDGVQEVFYAAMAFWSIFILIDHNLRYGFVHKTDIFVLLSIGVLAAYGAFMANVQYGQPLYFGLLEERRILALFAYFPIVMMLRNRWITIFELEKYFLASGLICAVIVLGTTLNVLPSLRETGGAENRLRGERISIGSSNIVLCIPLVLASRLIEPRRYDVPILLFLAGILLFVLQSRGLILAAAISVLYVLKGPRLPIAATGAFLFLSAAMLLIPGLEERLDTLTILFEQLSTEQYLTQSWRAMAYDHSLTAFASGEFWGHGALSPLWWGGFGRVIGNFFFLADIGIVGSLFRYGVLAIVVYAGYFAIQVHIFQATPPDRRRAFYVAGFLFLLVGLPVGAPLEHRGNLVAFFLAATHYLAYSSPARVKA
ncbi:hypothetical protein PF049_03765 [Erythrobacteraceae bacterium WH01K]|nr:hypothetical protein PF049_03765 [Erythrobacteraceae bacterium WH01K]